MSKPPSENAPNIPRESKRLVDEIYGNIERRFKRMALLPQPVVYEFTNERALLHQYYRIREIMYRKIHQTNKFDGSEDLHDKIAHVLIARRGKMVVGGCRLIVREGDEQFALPMEQDAFKIRSAFPKLHLTRLRHGEISRFAVLDSDQDQMEIMLALSQLIIEKSINEDLGYVFIKAPGMVMARTWRKIIATQCGQKEVSICEDVAIPEDPDYPEIQWKMIKTVLPAAKTQVEIAPTGGEFAFTVPTESIVH